MKSIIILILTLIVVTAAANPVFAQNTKIQTADSTKTVTIKVKGADCLEDLQIIAANVEKLKGVSSCKVIKEGVTSGFEVKYNPSLIAKKDIYTEIENTGGCDNPNDKPYKVKNKKG